MPVPVFDWTQESVDILKRLWAQGYAASQIAGELGGGCTRSAVCGKVHRLGLSGRLVTTRAPRPKGADGGAAVRSRKRKPVERYVAPGPKVLPKRDQRDEFGLASDGIVDIVEDHEIPLEQRRTVLTREYGECAWPVGDPASPDFYMCGAQTARRSDGERMPYCPHHCARAFQAPRSRREIGDEERARRVMQGRKNLAAHKERLAQG